MAPFRAGSGSIPRLRPFHAASHAGAIGTPQRRNGLRQDARQFYQGRFATEISEGLVHLFEGDSSTLLRQQSEGFYDVIYIDGDHSLEGVQRDAEAAIARLKPDGYLVFNDYTVLDRFGDPYRIAQVVNSLCVEHGWRMHYYALQIG